MALDQFRINMMNQGGGGGGFDTGASSGSSFMDIEGAFSKLRPPSPENMKKNIQTSFGKMFESLLGATKGAAGQLTPSNLGFLKSNIPHGLISSSANVPGMFSPSKGG